MPPKSILKQGSSKKITIVDDETTKALKKYKYSKRAQEYFEKTKLNEPLDKFIYFGDLYKLTGVSADEKVDIAIKMYKRLTNDEVPERGDLSPSNYWKKISSEITTKRDNLANDMIKSKKDSSYYYALGKSMKKLDEEDDEEEEEEDENAIKYQNEMSKYYDLLEQYKAKKNWKKAEEVVNQMIEKTNLERDRIEKQDTENADSKYRELTTELSKFNTEKILLRGEEADEEDIAYDKKLETNIEKLKEEYDQTTDKEAKTELKKRINKLSDDLFDYNRKAKEAEEDEKLEKVLKSEIDDLDKQMNQLSKKIEKTTDQAEKKEIEIDMIQLQLEKTEFQDELDKLQDKMSRSLKHKLAGIVSAVEKQNKKDLQDKLTKITDKMIEQKKTKKEEEETEKIAKELTAVDVENLDSIEKAVDEKLQEEGIDIANLFDEMNEQAQPLVDVADNFDQKIPPPPAYAMNINDFVMQQKKDKFRKKYGSVKSDKTNKTNKSNLTSKSNLTTKSLFSVKAIEPRVNLDKLYKYVMEKYPDTDPDELEDLSPSELETLINRLKKNMSAFEQRQLGIYEAPKTPYSLLSRQEKVDKFRSKMDDELMEEEYALFKKKVRPLIKSSEKVKIIKPAKKPQGKLIKMTDRYNVPKRIIKRKSRK